MTPEQERQAFESAIDANPMDASNHLVYADWLDEHSQPDEAAFRRSMGEWHADRSDPEYLEGLRWMSPNGPAIRHWKTTDNDLPDGVHVSHLYRQQVHFGIPDNPEHAVYAPRAAMAWTTYRGMENAFRRSFMANRSSNSQQMSRRVAARRFMRGK